MHVKPLRFSKIMLHLILLTMGFVGFAQAPNLLNYQGVARNAVGNPLPNQTMNLRLSVHNLTASGTTVYTETRVIKTNLGGLFSVQIGSAGTTSATGTIGGVNWLSGDKYLEVEIDPASNNNYLNMGTVQLVSVPYAFSAGTAGNAATVTTNANLTGVVTSIGNITSIAPSPTLTGLPTAPTAAPGTNTTQIATTEFVKAAALSGPTGSKGIQGLPGADGAAGPQGPAGIQGIQGLPGAAGTQGIQGLAGPVGPAGAQGIPGTPGASGAQGIQGVAGSIGPAGLQGILGTPGATGAPGATGSVANVGAISNSSTANGASITSGVLSLAPADATNGGIVTTAAQTFAGAKTFSNSIVTNGSLTAGAITYPNISGANGQVLTSNGIGVASWAAIPGGVTSVSPITLGTTGTDLTSSVADGSTTAVITLNVPDAAIGARGVVTTGTQTFAGAKTFNTIIDGSISGNAATVTTNANLTGNVTSNGNATTIAPGVITNEMLANVATATFKGRTTASTGVPEDLTVDQAKTLLNLTGINSGDQILPTLSSLGAAPTASPTFTGTASFSGTASATSVTAKQYVLTMPTAITAATTTIDLSTGNVIQVNLVTNITTLTLTNPSIGTYLIKLKQDGTGSRTVSFPGAWLWAGGTAPTVTATANKTDFVTLVYDGTNYYSTIVQNF